jgi:hypothetical protein
VEPGRANYTMGHEHLLKCKRNRAILTYS